MRRRSPRCRTPPTRASAARPCAYSPLFFASQVLADGKVVVVGGEDLGSVPGQVETNIGFLYDPVTNTWSSQLASAFDSGTVGDTMSTVLQNGTMIVSQITSGNIEAFNEATLSFTALNPPGKADQNNEEGWSILPNGKILAVDAFIQAQSEFYDPVANTWGTPLNTIVNMADTGNLGGTFEVGPATLRPDGLLISFSGNSLGQNAFFNTLTNTWSHPAGIDFPLVAGQTFHFAREGRHVRHASERKRDRDGRADRQRQRVFGAESLLGAGLRDQHAEPGRRFTERGRVRLVHGALHDAPERRGAVRGVQPGRHAGRRRLLERRRASERVAAHDQLVAGHHRSGQHQQPGVGDAVQRSVPGRGVR